jgi:hypothetical protein
MHNGGAAGKELYIAEEGGSPQIRREGNDANVIYRFVRL